MRQLLFIFFTFSLLTTLESQSQDSLVNTATALIQQSGKLNIGGYGEIHYNQPTGGDVRYNGNMDVHRMVMLFGYNFDPKLSFVTEIEFEHVKEVFIEQAFVNYKINGSMNFRGGLMLIPMGIVNEYHEPTTFFGVERPMLDKTLVPSTWREIGAGLSGNIIDASINYQAYLVNGFLSYNNGVGLLKGSNGLRSGRQKGAEAIFTSPNLATKVSYYGIKGLNLGFSLYAGNSQTALYDGLNLNDSRAVATADSSRIQLTMIGLDARYAYKGLKLRGQINNASIKNSSAYNELAGSDLGSKLSGFYIEAAYNILRGTESPSKLYPFVRIEQLDTHAAVEGDLASNLNYNRRVVTTGVNWIFANGVVFKGDFQFFKNKGTNTTPNQFNLGIGVWFK